MRVRRQSQSPDLQGLLRQTKRLRRQVVVFERSARDVAKPLGRKLSAREIEAMVTPRANVVGTLENLLNQDLGPLLRQLEELAGLLETGLPATGAPASTAGTPRRAEP